MSAAAEMPRYKCHKEVHALKIERIDVGADGRTVILSPADAGFEPFDVNRAFLDKHQPVAPGYFVVYADGYRSWSPVEAFEEGYTLIPADEDPSRWTLKEGTLDGDVPLGKPASDTGQASPATTEITSGPEPESEPEQISHPPEGEPMEDTTPAPEMPAVPSMGPESGVAGAPIPGTPRDPGPGVD